MTPATTDIKAFPCNRMGDTVIITYESVIHRKSGSGSIDARTPKEAVDCNRMHDCGIIDSSGNPEYKKCDCPDLRKKG